MDKEMTFDEFSRFVSELWATDSYKYGSVQFPAKSARNVLIEKGVTNANEMYEEYKRRKGESFWYAGD